MTRNNSKKVKLVCIGGPTASGKTEASLVLAEKFDGAIISCDSRQIYKELDVSTDKIPYSLPYHDPILYRGIEHYGINVAEIDKPFTLFDWMTYCRGAIAKIVNSGKIPFLVGGTGLYIQSIIENYKLKQDFDAELREELNKMSLKQLQTRLKELNPDLYEKIDVNNPRRVVRGIERAILSSSSRKPEGRSDIGDPENKSQISNIKYQAKKTHGSPIAKRPPSRWTFDSRMTKESIVNHSKSLHEADGNDENNEILNRSETHPIKNRIRIRVQDDKIKKFDSLVLSFNPERELIRQRIENRVKKHQEIGVIDEVKRLVEKYGADNQILNSTISVQEYIPYVLGKISLEKAQERVVINNYQYAKRQMTWFKKYGNTVFVDSVKEMEREIVKWING